MKIIITNERYDIYEILCHYYGRKELIHDTIPTNRLLLLGRANIDLRCVVFSYSWECSPELREIDLTDYDGQNEANEEYVVKTLNQKDIEEAIYKSYENELEPKEKIVSVKFSEDMERNLFITLEYE